MGPSTNSRTTPLVSLLVPLYQERGFIEALCASLDQQTFPADRLEVFFLDGGSTDGTREYLAQRVFACRARVVDNPRRLQVHALNEGLRLAAGTYVVRWDAHAYYAPDYIERCIALLEEDPTVRNCGGPMLAVGYDFASEVIADILNSPLGVGSARYRYAKERMEADTVFLGAFRRSDLLAAGGWNGDFAVAEDMELSLRLKKRLGGRFLVDPEIRVEYRPRNSISRFAFQYHQYGRYRIRLAGIHPEALRWTHGLPILLLPATAIGLGVGSWLLLAGSPWAWLFLSPLLMYALYAVTASALLAKAHRPRQGGFLKRMAYGAACLGAMHFSWSVGALHGILDRIGKRKPNGAV
jgi:cellulose synthase/poly-beta-1,6-N-acetylglucosamine synthase-like glycosyltransferase